MKILKKILFYMAVATSLILSMLAGSFFTYLFQTGRLG